MRCHLIIGVQFDTELDAHAMAKTNVGTPVARLIQPTIEAALAALFNAPIDDRLKIRWRLKGQIDDHELN
jgi:hypothetical protein